MDARLRELERIARSTGDRDDAKNFFINFVRSREIDLSDMNQRQEFFDMLADFKVRGVDCAYRDAVTLIYLIQLYYGMNNPGVHLETPGSVDLECFPDVALTPDRWDLDMLSSPEAWVQSRYVSFNARRIRAVTEMRRRGYDPSRLAARVGFQITYPNLGWQALDKRKLDIPDTGIISFHTTLTPSHPSPHWGEQSLKFIRERMVPLVAQVNPELAVVVVPDPVSFD